MASGRRGWLFEKMVPLYCQECIEEELDQNCFLKYRGGKRAIFLKLFLIICALSYYFYVNSRLHIISTYSIYSITASMLLKV
jgi:hypothetical protein